MLFFFLLFLAVFNRIVYKSSLNPIFLQSVLWLIYYSLLCLNIKSYDIHLYQVTKFILYQSVGFSLGGFICFLFTRKSSFNNLNPLTQESISISQRNLQILFPVFFLLQVASLLVYVKSTGNISILAIADVRDTLVEDDGKKFGTYGLIQMIMAVYLLLITLSKTKFTMWHKVLVGMFIYYTMLLGSRGQFVYYFITLFYILVWQKRISAKKILGSFAMITGLMYVLTVLRSAKAYGQTLTETLMIYTITSMPALHIAQFSNSRYFGYYSFRVLYVWLNKFGFNYPLSPVLSEYTMTPLPTNVYSYIKPYYMDFGYTGIFLLPLMLGFVHHFFYFRARRGSFIFMFLTSVLMYPLLMQVFEENYFRQFSNIVYSFILTALVAKMNIHVNRSSNSNLQPTN